MKSFYHAPIRKTHPTLFRLVVALAGVNFFASLFLFFGDAQTLINFNKVPESIFPPLWVYAILWTIAGFWLLWGLSGNGSYRWTRRGLTLSSMIGGYWALGFWINFIAGTILGFSAPLLWTFYVAICIILTNEPVINPLSAAIQNNFTTDNNRTTRATTRRTRKIKEHD